MNSPAGDTQAQEDAAAGAGRELDARVAALLGDIQDEEDWWVSADGSRYSDEDGGPRHYSTDLNAAWDAVSRLRELRLGLTLQFRGTGYRATFTQRFGPYPKTWGANAEEPAEAICRAALVAVAEMGR